MTAKLRFAPSPTGNLHIGSVRTAIFNWVWAKALNAQLVLRIEDTDQLRSKPEFEANILEGLEWMGLDYHEGPHAPKDGMLYRQSERMAANVYQPYIQQLLDSGHAYPCFETDTELDAERAAAEAKGEAYMYSRKSLQYSKEEVAEKLASGVAYTIRLKVPDNQTIVVKDAIRGDIPFESGLLSDFIIVKSDGAPTYNVAVVIDDHDMGITHVVRGEDHISNTPKQMLIFNALGLPVPVFAHLPIILGQDRSKLSKRHGAKSVSEYKDDGFLPHAVMNYLSLLGWSPPEGRELLSREELIELFNIERINKAGAVFDTVKLTWMNKQYLGQLSDDQFLSTVQPFLKQQVSNETDLNQKIISVRDNIDILSEIDTYLEVYRLDMAGYQSTVDDLEFNDHDCKVLAEIGPRFCALTDWTEATITGAMEATAEALGVSKGKTMKPIRKGVTGAASGPNLVACLALLGHSTIQERCQYIVEYVKTATSS